MGASDTYTALVAAYLRSSDGCDTPPITAARLYALGPGQLGMSNPPSAAQLHNARRMFDALEDQLVLDQSGAWGLPPQAILSA